MAFHFAPNTPFDTIPAASIAMSGEAIGMPSRNVSSRLLLCALLLCIFGGCAPERLIITDADDLAKFAAASKVAAEKKVADRKAAENAQPSTASNEQSDKTSKQKLDADSQAFLDRITNEQNLGASEVAQYEDLLSNLAPEMRATWVATQEAMAKRNKPAAYAPPRELPPTVRAEPIGRKPSAIQQADYREPISHRDADDQSPSRNEYPRTNTLSFANSELISELRSMKAELAQLRSDQKEQDASEAIREEAKEETDRQKLMLEALRGQGAMKGLAADDDVSGALSGLSTNFVHAEVAAAMAKSNARKSNKKAPLPSDPLPNDAPKLATSPLSSLPGANLEQLWNQIAGESTSDPSLSLAMRKKVFLLAAGDAGAASAPPEELTAAEKEYWKHLMRVLELSVKLGDHPRRDRQAALVGRELREAAAELESASVLDLQNAALCSSVQAFGNYVEFESTTFKPNDEVILYVELQNFASRERADGKAFETEFQGTYQILDAAGKRVADHDLSIEHGVCRQRRRDYFLAYRIHMPKSASDGAYTLQLTLEDKISGKFGQTTLKFSIQK